MNVTCPWCGASGVDDEPYPEPEEAPAFEMYGNYRGRPIRKCLKCGNGVSVAIFPRRFHKVQPDLWAQLQAAWEEHRANVDVRAETVAEDQQTYRQRRDSRLPVSAHQVGRMGVPCPDPRHRLHQLRCAARLGVADHHARSLAGR